MAKLRRFVAYRRLERPYTRFSKYKNKNYVRTRPVCKIARMDLGDQKTKYQFHCHLISMRDMQLRDNALESARQSANRTLEKVLGKIGYFIQVRKYPHHVLRENPLAAGAGADRMSTGMAHSFGKSIGIAAQIFEGDPIFTVKVNKPNVDLAVRALRKASFKLSGKYRVVVNDVTAPKKAAPKAAAK